VTARAAGHEIRVDDGERQGQRRKHVEIEAEGAAYDPAHHDSQGDGEEGDLDAAADRDADGCWVGGCVGGSVG